MNAEELRNEVALVSLGGHWSDDLTGGLAEVAAAAATDPRARTLAEQWIRSGNAEQMWASGSGIDSWVTLIAWVEWLNNNDLSAVTFDSLRAAFTAVIDVIGSPPGGSTIESDPLLEPL